MTGQLPAVAAPAIDPVAERAQFFYELELAELRLTIPQAEPQPIASAKY
jgi:hypothetical protein